MGFAGRTLITTQLLNLRRYEDDLQRLLAATDILEGFRNLKLMVQDGSAKGTLLKYSMERAAQKVSILSLALRVLDWHEGPTDYMTEVEHQRRKARERLVAEAAQWTRRERNGKGASIKDRRRRPSAPLLGGR